MPDPLTLTREDLYELVWSKPMAELAKDFRISDVGLAKRCRKLGIPVPGRGYWARVNAGQAPHRPSLRKHTPTYADHRTLTIAAPPPEPPSVAAESADKLFDRVEALRIEPSTDLLGLSPTVKRTGLALKHPASTSWTFLRGEKTGVIVSIDATPATLDRALLLADTLLRAAEQLGWTLVVAPAERTTSTESYFRRDTPPPSPPPRFPVGQLLVEGEQVTFAIEEGTRSEPIVPTAAQLAREAREYGYHAPRIQQVRTGKLRVVRFEPDGYYGAKRRSWIDRKGHPVEKSLQGILRAFLELSLQCRAEREKRENLERERAEAERRARALAVRREANEKLVRRLEVQAGAWFRAMVLRRYLRAVRRAHPEHAGNSQTGDASADFMAWANQYVDQLDPLHPQSQNPDMHPPDKPHYRADETALRESLIRLTGMTWPNAVKVIRPSLGTQGDSAHDHAE